GELNKLLMTRAEETGRVRIHFGQRLIDYDPDRRVARFEPSEEVRAGVIIGSDGSASTLRAGMGGGVSQEVLSSGYKELTMPPQPGSSKPGSPTRCRSSPGSPGSSCRHPWGG